MASARAAQSRKATQALRILVADDNRDAAASLAVVLRDEGHEALEVYRGDAVLDLTAQFKPDVLILDIGMPGLTGFEVARRLKQRRPDRPIVFGGPSARPALFDLAPYAPARRYLDAVSGQWDAALGRLKAFVER